MSSITTEFVKYIQYNAVLLFGRSPFFFQVVYNGDLVTVINQYPMVIINIHKSTIFMLEIIKRAEIQDHLSKKASIVA